MTGSVTGGSGPTTILSGGAGQVGSVVAGRLLRAGHRIALLDVAPDQAAGLEDAMRYSCDITDESAVRETVTDIARMAGGRITGLVNLAAFSVLGPSARLAPESLDRVMRINVTGAFICCKSVHPYMSDGGAIVNVATIAAHQGLGGRLAYCTSKAALLELTRCLAAEWAADGIRVNAVSPGYLMTDQLREYVAQGHTEIDIDALAGASLIGRLGDREEVADVVEFLLGSSAASITGTEVAIDGGTLARGEWNRSSAATAAPALDTVQVER